MNITLLSALCRLGWKRDGEQKQHSGEKTCTRCTAASGSYSKLLDLVNIEVPLTLFDGCAGLQEAIQSGAPCEGEEERR